MSLNGKYVIGDDTEVRTERDIGEPWRVEVYDSLEFAERERDALNDQYSRFSLEANGLEVPPWRVYQLTEVSAILNTSANDVTQSAETVLYCPPEEEKHGRDLGKVQLQRSRQLPGVVEIQPQRPQWQLRRGGWLPGQGQQARGRQSYPQLPAVSLGRVHRDDQGES